MTTHMCPFACSRCDITCPCTCSGVVLQAFNDAGDLIYREERCRFDLSTPPGQSDIEGGNR